MTKQEQIEEMAKVDCGKCNFCNTCDNCKFKWHDDCEKVRIASNIYAVGYRKIPENALVLTNEEYIDLSRNYVGEQIDQARKETAKEIYDLCCGHGTTFIKKYLKEKYGVEVEE